MSEHPWTILIAERGFIFAGRVHREGDRVVLDDAYVVRRYCLETKDGLGGLAARGPTQGNDILDAAPLGIGVYVFGVLGDFPCQQTAWATWHAGQTKAKK